MKLRRKYLNSGDVFILDLGLRAIQVGHVVMTHACHYYNGCTSDPYSGMGRSQTKMRDPRLLHS